MRTVEKLRREWPISTRSPHLGSQPVNPDGPEAAALIEELVEALEEARLIVANLPHDESLFLAKIDAALAKAHHPEEVLK